MKLRIACGVAGIFQSRRAISNNDCILDRSPDCKTSIYAYIRCRDTIDCVSQYLCKAEGLLLD